MDTLDTVLGFKTIGGGLAGGVCVGKGIGFGRKAGFPLIAAISRTSPITHANFHKDHPSQD